MTKLIEVPFGLGTRGAQRNYLLDGGPDPPEAAAFSGVEAMWLGARINVDACLMLSSIL